MACTRSKCSTGARGRSRESTELTTPAWADWFNRQRRLAPIGHIPPTEGDVKCSAKLAECIGLDAHMPQCLQVATRLVPGPAR